MSSHLMVFASRETEAQKGLGTYSSSHCYLGLKSSSFFFFLNHFIEICLTCKKLYIFNTYNSVSLGISIFA